MTGTKFGCGQALCGACTMHVDGAATRSCITTVDSIGESAITTIEAIGQAPQGAALQKAWLELEVVQTAIIAGLPYTRLRDAILAHPTMAEGLDFLLSSVPARNVQPAMPQTSAYAKHADRSHRRYEATIPPYHANLYLCTVIYDSLVGSG